MSNAIRMGVSRVRICPPVGIAQNATCVSWHGHIIFVWRDKTGKLRLTEPTNWQNYATTTFRDWEEILDDCELREVLTLAVAEKLLI